MSSKKSNSAILLATTALVTVFAASDAYAAPQELAEGNTYSLLFNETDGYTASAGGARNAGLEEVLGSGDVGQAGGDSLAVSNNTELTLGLLGDVNFLGKVLVESGSTLTMTNDGNLKFLDDVGTSTINAGNGTSIEYSNGSVNGKYIGSSIYIGNANHVVDVYVNNALGASNDSMVFENGLTHEDSVGSVNSLTIGGADVLNGVNGVIYRGEELNADTIYLGTAGGTQQTNSILFNNSSTGTIVNGNIVGNAADENTIVIDEANVQLMGTVAGVDELTILADGNLEISNDYTGGDITVVDNNHTDITINNEGKADSDDITSVTANITSTSSGSGGLSVILWNTNFSGEINYSNNVNNDRLTLIENAEMSGEVAFGDGDDNLETYGSGNLISGDIDFGDGDDSFSIGDETATVSGSLTNLEDLYIFDGGLNLQADLSVDATMMGNANLRIAAGKTLTTGDLYQDSGSTLTFDIASPSSAGFLDVTGSALDLTDITLAANVTGADNLFTSGNTIKVASGDGALIGINGNTGLTSTEVNENSALFKIMAMDGGKLSSPLSANDLYYVFQQEQTIEEVAENPNAKAAGHVLDTISNTSNPQLAQIISNINAANADEVNEIVSKLTPTVDMGGTTGTQNFVNNTLDVANQRIASVSKGTETGMSAGNQGNLRAWSQVFGQMGDQDERGGIAGYDTSTYGAAFGLDTESLVEGTLVGGVFSYGNTNVNSKNANRTGTDIDSYQLTLYANHDFEEGSFVKGMAAYAMNNLETTRYDVGGIGLTAFGDYDADIYTARVEGGHNYQIQDTRITPSVMAHYSHYSADDYAETGAGGSGLTIAQDDLQLFEVGAGVEAGWDIKTANGAKLSPEVRAGYRYDLIGDNLNVTSSFIGGGGAFTTQGVDPAQGTASVGAGVTYYADSNWEFSANYEFEHKSDYSSNSGFLRASYDF